MKSLLDAYIPTHRTVFRPTTAKELFALRLGQKLNDPAAFEHYLGLGADYSEGQLLAAYRSTMREPEGTDLGRAFLRVLERTRNGHSERQARLIAIRVERRSVAVAIFYGEYLEYTDVRQLSSNPDKALVSAVGFANWILERFSVESAALEAIPNGREFQRKLLYDSICHELRERLLPIWEVPRDVLLGSCGYPALKSRSELRQVATSIWPILAGTKARVFVQDAAMLGLHVQIERLFIINSSHE